MDHAARVGGLPERPSATASLRLHGAPPGEHVEHSTVGTPARCTAADGTDADRVRDLAEQDPSSAVPMHPRLPYLMCEVAWAVREEMALGGGRALPADARSGARRARGAGVRAGGGPDHRAGTGRDEAWVKDQLAASSFRAKESVLPTET